MYRILLFAIIHYTRVQSHKNSIWLYLQFNCLLSKCLGHSQTIFMTGTLYCTYSLLTSLLFAAIRYISFSRYSISSFFDVFKVALTHYVSIEKRAPILFLSTPQLSNFVISALSLWRIRSSFLHFRLFRISRILRKSHAPFVSVYTRCLPSSRSSSSFLSRRGPGNKM